MIIENNMRIKNLSIVKQKYGNDYYWNDTRFMTSAPLYAHFKVRGRWLLIHIVLGIKYGKGNSLNTRLFPRIWVKIMSSLLGLSYG